MEGSGSGKEDLPAVVKIVLGLGIPLLIAGLIVVVVIFAFVICKLHKSKTQLERRITEKM